MSDWTPLAIESDGIKVTETKTDAEVRLNLHLTGFPPPEWTKDFLDPSSRTLGMQFQINHATITTVAEVSRLARYMKEVENRITWANDRYVNYHLPKKAQTAAEQAAQKAKTQAVVEAAIDKVKSLVKPKAN